MTKRKETPQQSRDSEEKGPPPTPETRALKPFGRTNVFLDVASVMKDVFSDEDEEAAENESSPEKT